LFIDLINQAFLDWYEVCFIIIKLIMKKKSVSY